MNYALDFQRFSLKSHIYLFPTPELCILEDCIYVADSFTFPQITAGLAPSNCWWESTLSLRPTLTTLQLPPPAPHLPSPALLLFLLITTEQPTHFTFNYIYCLFFAPLTSKSIPRGGQVGLVCSPMDPKYMDHGKGLNTDLLNE